jgi:hypothetical protein
MTEAAGLFIALSGNDYIERVGTDGKAWVADDPKARVGRSLYPDR